MSVVTVNLRNSGAFAKTTLTVHRGDDVVRAFVVLVFGAAYAIRTKLVGDIYGTDILAILALPLLVLLAPAGISTRDGRVALLLATGWLVNLMLTDAIRSTPWADMMRGWAKVGTLTALATSFWLLSRGRVSLVLLLVLAVSAGAMLGATLNPDEYQRFNPWKFGYGQWVLLSASILACLIPPRGLIGRSVRALILLSVAMLSLYLGTRFVFACGVTAAAITFAGDLFGERERASRVSTGWIVSALIAAVGLLLLVQAAYGALASTGTLGAKAQQTYRVQTVGGTESAIFGGRSELMISVKAIADSPIIGHGSWARDRMYVDLLIEMLRSRGVTSAKVIKDDLIPTHSHLTGAWVEAGLMGGLFWIFVLAISLRTTVQMAVAGHRYLPALAATLALLFWNVIFSPFGSGARVLAAAQICLVLAISREFANGRECRAQTS